jgi:hypothetical protein
MFNKATGSDKESLDARQAAELPIVRGADVVRHDMPQMSDGEIYLRLNVPDGLQNNGEQPQKYVSQVIDSHEGSGSAIRHDLSGYRLNFNDKEPE